MLCFYFVGDEGRMFEGGLMYTRVVSERGERVCLFSCLLGFVGSIECCFEGGFGKWL